MSIRSSDLKEKNIKTVRQSYVKQLRDNYLLILRTLMHDLIVSVDANGIFVFVNDAAVNFWAEPRQNIVGTHFTDFLHPDDVKKAVSALQELINGKNMVKSFILRVKSPKGFRTVAWNGVAVFDDDKNYVGAQATGKDLTDSLRAEQELKQSKQHLQRLFEVIVDPIVIVDMTGKIIDFSQSAEEILGFPRGELVGKHFLETSVATPESKAVMKKNLASLKKGLPISPHTVEAVTEEGKKLLYELTPTRITYKGEQSILAIFRNITEQKKAEENLRASEERFRYFIENAPEAIWVQDLTGTFLDGNKRAEEITGYRREELIGKNILKINFVPAKYTPRILESFQTNLKGERSGPTELELIRKDGSLVFVEASSIPVERNGKIEIIGIARDISTRKKSEDALLDSEKRFRELSELLPEVVFETDATGTLKFVNQAAFERFGYPQESIYQKFDVFQMLVPEDRNRAKNDFTKVLSGTDTGFVEYTGLRKDGTIFPIIIHSTPVIHENKPVGIRGIIVDITERKALEDKLLKQNQFMNKVLDTITYPFYVIDANDYTIKLANSAAEFGDLSKDSTCYALTHKRSTPCSKPEHACTLEQIKKTKKPAVLEHIHYDNSGNPRTFELRGYPIFDNEGNIVQIIESGLDITERKEAEEKLKKSEERFRSTLDSMLEGCQIVGYDWRYIYVNDTAIKHAQLPRKELLGKTMMQVYPNLEKTNLFSILNNCMTKRVPAHLENEFTYLDGKTAWFEISIEPVPEGIFILSIDISDRKEVAEALRQQREMLETVTANINAGLAVISRDYHIMWANKILKSFFPKEIEGATCYSVLNKHESVCPKCGVKEIFDTGKNLVIHEQEISTPTGPVWLEITAAAIKDETGKIVAASEMSVDITERKKLENELKESLQKFRTIFEGATDGIVAVDPKTQKFVFANPRMYEMTGYGFGELTNLSFSDIVPKADLDFALGQLKEHLEGKIRSTRNVAVLKKDKTHVYCDVSSRLMKIGNEQFLIGFLRDVTEQKKIQDALQSSEKNYRTILSTMNDTVWIIDFNGKFIDVNDASAKVLGYSRDELLSMGILDIDDSLSADQIGSLIDQVKNTKNMIFETEHTTKEGKKVPVEIISTLVNYQGKEAILSIARDITERKKAEDVIDEAMRLLKQSNQELESYTYVVSHDLKAPLRTIKSFGSFLLEDYGTKLDATGQDYLNRMVNASTRMDSMIEDLLILSRVGRKFTEFETVDLNILLDEILSDLEATINETKTKVVVEKLPSLMAQRVWMRQLFMNLISNALKFNESKTPKIEVLYQEREVDHLFKVQDNGIGIDEKYLTRIFNLFERAPTEKKYDGTGAGLSICKKIVEHLEGKIWVESTLGKGITFFFTIPKKLKSDLEKKA